MIKKLLGLWLVGCVLAACQTAAPAQAPPPPTAEIELIYLDPPWEAESFPLLNTEGEEVQLSDYLDKPTLVYFGFTYCPDQCPTTLGIWKTVYNRLGDQADQVNFIFISVDPERDTPERMGEYLAFFDAGFIGLTGTLGQIEDVAMAYRISFDKVTDQGEDASDMTEGYLIAHTTQTFLIDANQTVPVIFPYNTDARTILSVLEEYLD